MPRYRSHGRQASKPDRGATAFCVYGVHPTRRVEPDSSFRTEIVAIVQQRVPVRLDGTIALQGADCEEEFIWLRGGATVIIDPREDDQKIRLSIIKNTGSETRRGVSSRRARRICRHCARSISAPALLHAGQGDDQNG